MCAEQCAQGHCDGDAGIRATALPQPVQAALPPASAHVQDTISVEIRRGSTAVQAELPLDARSAAWLREVLG